MKEGKKNEHPLVSIITVNFNQPDLTLDLVRSLRKITYPAIEIIVVDNGSTKGNIEKVKREFPEVILLKSADNLGFAGGNNLGIKAASGKYLFFLNNDTEVDPGFLEPMVELMESNPRIGMVSPKIIYFFSENKKTIQYAGSTGINPATGRGKKIGSRKIDSGQYDDVRETALGHGAAMMIPMKVVIDVGLMADLFFLYYEEHDWCERIKRAGYKVYYCGKSVIFHKESMSVGKATPLRIYYMTRGRLIYIRRNARRMKKLTSLLFFTFFSVPKNSLKYIMQKRFDLLKAFWQAWMWHWNHHRVKLNPQIKTDQKGNRQIVNDTKQQIKTFT